MSKEKPRWLILWRHNGVNYWEAVPDNKMDAFIEKLLLVDRVNPATIFMGMGMMMNWMFPSYHKELRSVWIKDIYDETIFIYSSRLCSLCACSGPG